MGAPGSLYARFGQPPTGAAQNFEKPPSQPDHVILFEPPWPSDLAPDPELWVAATGPGDWGAGTVGISEDDDHYEPVGRVRRATCGVLTSDLPRRCDRLAGLGVEVYHDGQLAPFSTAALLRRESLVMIGTAASYELLAYTASDLDAPNHYQLSGLVLRGLYDSLPQLWPAGTPLLRLDAAPLAIPIPRRLLGWDLYLKLVSENVHGEGHDDAQTIEPLVYRLGQRGWGG
jgi:hypothetical protein